jgi:hypothetical protein
VAYSTRELEDDWYRTVQLLYDLGGSQPALVRWNSYRYQIAGLEDTPMWLLWIINTVVLALAYVARDVDLSGLIAGRKRILSLTSGVALLLVGSTVILVALSDVQEHDPWLVVFLLTAILMMVSGAYIAIRSRKRAQTV